MLALAGLALVVQVGCQAAAPVELSPAAAEGKRLFVAKGCIACHRAPGVPEAQGTIGPSLRAVGDLSGHPKIAAVVDNTPENMLRWLMNPSELKPGTAMPSLGLSEDEAAKLAAFLETLK